MDSGAINTLIEAFGGERTPFFREPGYFWSILISSSIWKELGWNSIIYLAALAGIDSSLYEASMMDGAGRLKRLVHITLPGIAPVIAILLILNMGTLMGGGMLDAVYNLSNPLVMEKAIILDYHVYIEGIRQVRYSYAAAVGLFQSVICFLLVAFSNFISRKMSGTGAF